jgi:hypothetical protein
MDTNTTKRLAEMTDERMFERLATAVLREADAKYAALTDPGVNADGKTVRAPLSVSRPFSSRSQRAKILPSEMSGYMLSGSV